MGRLRAAAVALCVAVAVCGAAAAPEEVVLSATLGNGMTVSTVIYVEDVEGRCLSDSDGDGVPDCRDECPNDPALVSDNDSDVDGSLDCNDGCPSDSLKTDAGVCGCGVPDEDQDGDSIMDCVDTCPAGPNNVDADNDGIPDACDTCPEDADNDADNDGTCAPADGCPTDPDKQAPGACGCNNPEDASDADNDGVPGCVDVCPDGDDNQDTDSDGVPDACDECPLDAANDSDGDGTCAPDDECPDDPNKTNPLVCGCGVAESGDDDNDSVCNAGDNCPLVGNPTQSDGDGDGIGDACDDDLDNDGALNGVDLCPNTPSGASMHASHAGCSVQQVAAVDADDDGVCDGASAAAVCTAGPDLCPDTSGAANSKGCSAAQVDADGDGRCDDPSKSDNNAAFCTGTDVCLGFDDTADADGDGIPDGCDNACVVSTFTIPCSGAYDGFILRESATSFEVQDSFSGHKALRFGDNSANEEYKAFLDCAPRSVRDASGNAVSLSSLSGATNVRLLTYRGRFDGRDPMSDPKYLGNRVATTQIDLAEGFFGPTRALTGADFTAAATQTAVLQSIDDPGPTAKGQLTTFFLDDATGSVVLADVPSIQMRMYVVEGSNNDGNNDQTGFWPAEDSTGHVPYMLVDACRA